MNVRAIGLRTGERERDSTHGVWVAPNTKRGSDRRYMRMVCCVVLCCVVSCGQGRRERPVLGGGAAQDMFRNQPWFISKGKQHNEEKKKD